jgi:subtilisin family serine protease
MFDAIKASKDAGVLFVAAAGNDGMDNDKRTTPTYPSSYQVENIISVAASTNTDSLASFSNYGKRLVHIAAPGHKVYSTIPGGKFDTYSGTSMATPHVAGGAALLWSTDKSLTAAAVKDRLLATRDYVSPLSRKISSSGRMNVYNAINNIVPPAPPEPTEAAWKTLDLSAAITTAHPYANNAVQEWVIEGPAEAKFIRLQLGKVDLESGYDFLAVQDANGVEVDNITGKFESYNTWYAEGNKLKLKFSSDTDVTAWGFEALKYQVIY